MTVDSIKLALIRLIEQVTARFDWYALYPAKVVSQNADGTLELKPDSTRFGPGLSHVPLRLGLPGVSVKVAAGSRVLLGFESGNPSKPVATLWDTSTLTEITVTASTKATVNAPTIMLGASNLPAARQGDMVSVGSATIPTMMTFGAPVPPPGPPVPLPIITGVPVPVYFPLPLYGLITSGNPQVRE